MKRLLVVFLFFASFLVSAKPLDSLRLELKQGKKFIVYRVTKGEQIEDIALKYETEESTLLSMNPLIQTEVKPGQIIKIPLNIDKYGDIPVPEVKPIEYMALPLASSLPPPSQKQLPSKQLMATSDAIPAEVKSTPEPITVIPANPKSSEPIILGEPIAQPAINPAKPMVPELVVINKPAVPSPVAEIKPTVAASVVQIPVAEVNKQTDKVPATVSANTPSTSQKEPTLVTKKQEAEVVTAKLVPAEVVAVKIETPAIVNAPNNGIQNKIDQSPSQAPVLQDTLKVAAIHRKEAQIPLELSGKGLHKLVVKPIQKPIVNVNSKPGVMARKSGGYRAKLQQELDNKEAMAFQVKSPEPVSQTQLPVQQNLPVTDKVITQAISARDTVSMELIDKAIVAQAPKLIAKPIAPDAAVTKPKKIVKNSVISGRTTDKLIPKENQVAADYITDVYDKKGDLKIAQDLSILKDTLDKNEEKALQIYVVTEPQTVKKLAAILKIDPKLIYDANDFSSPNLWPGQKIWIPEGAAALETTVSHLNESQKAQKAKRNSNLNQIIKEENDEEGFSAVDLETDSFVVKNEPKELLAEVDNTESIDSSDYRPDLDKLHIGSGVQTSQHVFVNREVDTSIAKHYGEIGEVGVRILNDFSFYDDNAITYSAIDFREQHLAVDEWAVNAADSNASYFKKEPSKQGPGDRQFTHVVKDGETLLSIAKKYDVTQSDLANWNNLMKYRLRTGQELIVNQSRGKLSYYERSLEKNQNKTVLPVELSDLKQNGLAYYNPSDKLKGVLMNNVPVGKWIQIHNNDKFKKRVVQVLGPLPYNAPKDCLLMIDKYTASNLEIKNITSRVSVNIAEIR